MSPYELAQLELVAEVDGLVDQLREWIKPAPRWPAARQCEALVRRLVERADTLRVRLEAPLVVATIGGTGTGKSTLVNALVGSEVTQTGRERPTTRKPTLICRPDLSPEELGIDPASVHVVRRDLPALRDLVLVDCPDPDTTEDPESSGTNLARLRELLPHCDVLLVTGTQQKYRSARVLDELAAAAPGARLAFVQTHADVEDDIRDDWRTVLADEYRVGDMLLVDSVAALADARAAREPRGDFARLVDLLTRELAGAAGNRIRRANFLDLVENTLAACRRKIGEGLPALDQLETALAELRTRLAANFGQTLRSELLTSRRPWEARLLAEVTRRWGFSPFSLVLRGYQGLGGILTSVVLLRARSPAQLALWGALEGGRSLRRRQQERHADASAARAAILWADDAELRTAAIIIDGYAGEAGLSSRATDVEGLLGEAQQAGEAFVGSAAVELDSSIQRLAGRHAGPMVRVVFESLLAVMLVLLFYRLGRNFFWDSWLAAQPQPLFGVEFFVAAALWLTLWCALLLWAFTSRLRRGLRAEINTVVERATSPARASSVFGGLERECRAVRRFSGDLQRLEAEVHALQERVRHAAPRLGQRVI